MALRIEEESIVSGVICNREKGVVRITLNFADGRTLQGELKGNPYRDLAGRILSFKHPEPEPDCPQNRELRLEQKGVTGDITAARKVRVPLIPMDQVGEYYAEKKEIPTTWKNSLYLEWYSPANGRVVLEASEFELTMTEPAWVMTDQEEQAAHEAAVEALTDHLDLLCRIDLDDEPKGDPDGKMNEFEWEQFLRKADQKNDRYGELIDKFGIEEEEKIAAYMGWDEGEEGGENDDEAANGEVEWRDGPGIPDFSVEEDFDDLPERKRHPLNGRARAILKSIEVPDQRDSPLGDFRFAVAMVSAKVAGALSALEWDYEPDPGFVIAKLKRCLTHIDTAVGQAQSASPSHVQPLLKLRQEVIDLQNEMRKK